MSEHIETHCPHCDADLHVTNFTVRLSDRAILRIDCWRCTWNTEFEIERFNEKEPD